MGSVLQTVASAAAVPASAIAGQLHRWRTGRSAILELTVRSWEDTVSRQAMIRRLGRVANDPSVVGLLLEFHGVPGNWAACQDFRRALQGIRRAGKCVYAALEAPANKQIWLASACDRVFIVPTGEVSLLGVGAEIAFFGRALERLGVAPDFEAAGAYKSFGEPYTRSFASPENQEAMQALVDDLHGQLVNDIADGRRLRVQDVEQIVRDAPLSAEQALEARLVDQLAYPDEMDDWIAQHHGANVRRGDFASWARRDAILEWIEGWGLASDQVAVLHLEGPIVMEHAGAGAFIRARNVVEILDQLREDGRVKAVVLHVNSPGGQALASDLMWRAVERLRRAKPVVASFEDVAASGGYYLAAPAQEILARPGTLTGSIGVFGGKLVLGEGLRRIGVTTQAFMTGPNAAMLSATRPFTPEQRVRFRSSLQRFYDGFVQRVASGRRMPAEAIEPFCRGRVWTGAAARERGLVDRYGDLADAVERARSLSGLHVGDFRRRDMAARPHRSFVSRLVSRLVRELMPAGARVFERLAGITPSLGVVIEHQGQPLALLPFDISTDD